MNISTTNSTGRQITVNLHPSGKLTYPLAIRGALDLGTLTRPAVKGGSWTAELPDGRAAAYPTRTRAVAWMVAQYEQFTATLPLPERTGAPITGVMGTETVRHTRSWSGLYFGRRAHSVVYEHTGKRDGLRTQVLTWDEQAHESNGGHPRGTVVTRVMRGDGRRGDFEILHEHVALPVLPTPTA